MGRASQAQAEEHRKQIIAAASQLFREKGMQNVSVAEIMGAVGLTHGGFYRQFESKEALLPEATEHAYSGMRKLLEDFDSKHGGHSPEARNAFLQHYLSEAHRDEAGKGCPTAGLMGEIAREDDPAARAKLVEGIEHFATWVSGTSEPDFTVASTLVGALLLSRATKGTELSGRILREALDRLSAD